MLRGEKLPRETGGVLLAAGLERNSFTLCIRSRLRQTAGSASACIFGSSGLREQWRTPSEDWAHAAVPGEWHSHPDGYGTAPSKDDYNVWAWIAEKTQVDGYPGNADVASAI